MRPSKGLTPNKGFLWIRAKTAGFHYLQAHLSDISLFNPNKNTISIR